MTGETTTSDWGGYGYSFNPGSNLWAKVSRVLDKFSDNNRQKKYKEKLRKEIVRDHILGSNRELSLIAKISKIICRSR